MTDTVAKETKKIVDVEVLDAEGASISLPDVMDIETLPAVIPDKSLTVYSSDKATDPLTKYLQEIGQYKILTLDEERALTQQLAETGDVEVAKKLVVANLRLVVKIAMEYKGTYQNVLDLIQEGNIGLMKAVSKYNPEKGAKLSYYASWWIRSYVLKFILDNFRLVKIGTTNDQKKLFFNLMKEKQRLESMGIKPDNKLISANLGVSEKAVATMEHRLSSDGGEFSIDTPLSSDGTGATYSDMLADSADSIEGQVSEQQELSILKEHLGDFVTGLKDRDRDIFKKRLMSEVPPSLQSIADEYGVSRERIRQIEERLVKSLKSFMKDYF